MDASGQRPAVIDKSGTDVIAVWPIDVLTQSFDHRAIDGACIAAFLHGVKASIEQGDWDEEFN